jgi:hypothetical protein
MKKIIIMMVIAMVIAGITVINAQTNATATKTKVLVYYFHPDERCPIDQSIEKNTILLMQSLFVKEIKDGIIKFQVINTDDKANAKAVANFDINAQALYVVKIVNGKEIRKDLTKFAFDYGQSNPEKFRTGLKEEINKALDNKAK